jgi:hypothetical protein
MLYFNINEEGYNREYIRLRWKIDRLCRSITAGQIGFADAEREYKEIETEFSQQDSQKADLFKMIYGSRIIRLCGQFQSEGI